MTPFHFLVSSIFSLSLSGDYLFIFLLILYFFNWSLIVLDDYVVALMYFFWVSFLDFLSLFFEEFVRDRVDRCWFFYFIGSFFFFFFNFSFCGCTSLIWPSWLSNHLMLNFFLWLIKISWLNWYFDCPRLVLWLSKDWLWRFFWCFFRHSFMFSMFWVCFVDVSMFQSLMVDNVDI